MPMFNFLSACYITDIRGSKYLTMRDVERCPFLPKNPGYEKWDKDDQERCKVMVEARRELHIIANQYISHEDRNVRNLAHAYIDRFGDVE